MVMDVEGCKKSLSGEEFSQHHQQAEHSEANLLHPLLGLQSLVRVGDSHVYVTLQLIFVLSSVSLISVLFWAISEAIN